MKSIFNCTWFILLSILVLPVSHSQSKIDNKEHEESIPRLENPITVKFLNENLAKQSPRLVLNPEIERNLKSKIQSDPVVKNMFDALKLNADQILKEPLLERKMTGRRLLHVSREYLYRMNVLGMVYRLERDPAILQRIQLTISVG